MILECRRGDPVFPKTQKLKPKRVAVRPALFVPPLLYEGRAVADRREVKPEEVKQQS